MKGVSPVLVTVELQSSVTIGGHTVSSGSNGLYAFNPSLGWDLFKMKVIWCLLDHSHLLLQVLLEWKSAIVKIIDWLDLKSRVII